MDKSSYLLSLDSEVKFVSQAPQVYMQLKLFLAPQQLLQFSSNPLTKVV